MILRKPYALFIKSFKFIHILLSIGIGYSVYRMTFVLSFLNESIVQPGAKLIDSLDIVLFDYTFYLIPIFLFVVSGLVLGILVYKQKPYKFYAIVLVILALIFGFNVYLAEYLYQMEMQIMTSQSMSLVRDLVLISIILQSLILIKYFITSIGFDITNFDFGKDLEEMAIEEADREEVEVNLEWDVHTKKRKAKNLYQQFRYYYFENQFLVNVIAVLSFIIFSALVYSFFNENIDALQEQNVFFGDRVNMSVNRSYITSENFRGAKVGSDENVIVVVDAHMVSRQTNPVTIDKTRFKLRIGNYSFYHTDKYRTAFSDIGITYQSQNIEDSGNNYILVFEIPESFMNRDMYFHYIDRLNPTNEKIVEDVKIVLLRPNEVDEIEKVYKNDEDEKIYLREPLLHSFLAIRNVEISEEFLVNYGFCPRLNECFWSYKYVQPSYTANYDVALMQVEGEFVLAENLQHLKINLADFLHRFGYLSYELDGKNKLFQFQRRLDVANLRDSDIYYFEVPIELLDVDTIELNIVLRNFRYTQMLMN